MDYLDEDQIRRAKMCVCNIEDKIKAIRQEVYNSPKAYKTYLREKVSSIYYDAMCLNRMVEEDVVKENEED